VDYWSPVREVIYFKRSVYARALDELGRLAFPMGLPPRPDWWSEEVVRPNTNGQRVRTPRSRRKRRRRSAVAAPGEGGGPQAP
jgi:putative (di)nucleoside polyphosphate hydrolase